MLVGSFASARYSSPRSTQDIDIVISSSEDQLRNFLKDLGDKDYYVDINAALEALRQQSLFNVIDMNSGWKIDFIIRKSAAFSREEFSRRGKVEIHGLQIFVASPEDIIIAKLRWAKQGASQRQIEDAAAVLRVQGETLDNAYLERWVSELQLLEEWDSARRLAASS